MVTVSVIIPTYNDEDFLPFCLESVVHQSLQNIEIICINDGSIDATGSILEEYQKQWDNVKVYSQQNQGAGAARNRGISLAQGEYIAFMDGDDYYPSNDVLECLYKTAKKENVKLCGGSYTQDKKGTIIRNFSGRSAMAYFNVEKKMSFEEYPFPIGFTKFIYERQMLIKEKIEFPNIRIFEDPLFLVLAMIKGNEFYAIKKEVYRHRIYEHTRCEFSYQDAIDTLTAIKEIFSLAQQHQLVKLQQNIALTSKDTFEREIIPYYESADINYMNCLKEINACILQEAIGKVEGLTQYLSQEGMENAICKAEKEYFKFAQHIENSKNIIIYGAGIVGQFVLDVIKNNFKKSVLGITVTKLPAEELWVNDIKVTSIQDWKEYRDNTTFIVAVTTEKQAEICNTLKQLKVNKMLAVDYNKLYCFVKRAQLGKYQGRSY